MLRPILLGSLLTLATACSTDQGAPANTRWQLNALTFNTALAPGFEPNTAARLPKVLSALSDAAPGLDLMCIQELWEEPDFAALKSALGGALPNTLHRAPTPGSGSCSSDELGSLGACVQSECDSAEPERLVACIQTQCTTEVTALSGGCLGCLINHLGTFEACATAGAAATGDPAIFGGNSDIALFSRFPIVDQEILPLDAYFQRGTALYARIEVPQLGTVHAFCTHFSSPLGVIPYAGPDGSWDGEHARETEELVRLIAAHAGDGERVLVMGDLNTGLALNGNGAVLPDDLEALLATGLRDPYLDGGRAECSECSDNSLRSPDSSADLIDHLLIRGFPEGSASVSRAFTSQVEIGAEGNVELSHLSDHYGLMLQLGLR